MPESIKSTDLYEAKILADLINQLDLASKSMRELNTEAKATATVLKGNLKDVKLVDSASIAEANLRIKEAESLVKMKILADKEAIKTEQLASKLRQQQAREQSQINREKEREIKATEKQVNANNKLSSIYSTVSGKLNKLRAEYRDLAIKKEVGIQLSTKEEIRMASLEKRIGLYDSALKKVDSTMGIHNRNVGNYASGWNGLGNSINQLTREMPAFANSMQTGFMAISNNLPTFFDEIAKIKKANVELQATGQPTVSVFKQIASSIFSVGTLLSVGVTLLTVYGAKLAEYIYSLTGAQKAEEAHKKEIEKKKEAQKRANEQVEKNINFIGEESAHYVGLIEQLKTTNRNSKERRDLINEINEQYGTTLKNLSDEKAFQDQLNNSIKQYILSKRLEFRLKANEENIVKGIAKQEKLRMEALKLNLPVEKQLLKEILDGKKNISELGFSTLLSKDQLIALNRFEAINGEVKTIDSNMERWGLNMAKIKDELAILGFDESKNKGTIEAERDLTREIEDENTKRIDNEYQRNALELIINAERRKEDLDKENSDGKQRAKLKGEIDKTLHAELVALDKKYWEEIEKNRKDAFEKWKSDNLALLNADYEKDIAKAEHEAKQSQLSLELSQKTDEEKAQIEKQNQIDLLEEKIRITKLYGKETIDLEIELAELKGKKVIQKEQDYTKMRNDIIKASADYFIEQSNRRIEALDKEIAQHEKAYSLYAELAKNGNITAKESLALENQQIVEANKKKAQEQKKQQYIKLAETALTAYSANASNKDVKNPLTKTATDVTLLLQFIKSLPAFYDGTEDTGTNGNGIDGKGGFLSVLHPNERVLTKEQNAMLGGISNNDLAETMYNLNSGKLVNIPEGATQLGGNWNFEPLLNEIKDLKETIKNKPDIDLQVGELIQGTVDVVTSKTQGNTRFSNRYRVG